MHYPCLDTFHFLSCSFFVLFHHHSFLPRLMPIEMISLHIRLRIHLNRAWIQIQSVCYDNMKRGRRENRFVVRDTGHCSLHKYNPFATPPFPLIDSHLPLSSEMAQHYPSVHPLQPPQVIEVKIHES